PELGRSVEKEPKEPFTENRPCPNPMNAYSSYCVCPKTYTFTTSPARSANCPDMRLLPSTLIWYTKNHEGPGGIVATAPCVPCKNDAERSPCPERNKTPPMRRRTRDAFQKVVTDLRRLLPSTASLPRKISICGYLAVRTAPPATPQR